MAIDGNIYAPSQFRLAIAEESTFGTPITTQSSFYELDLISPTQPDMASGVVEDIRKRSDGKRVMSQTDFYRRTTGGLYVIPVEFVVTEDTVDLAIYGVMQDLTSSTNVDTKYNNIWEWDGSTTGPDFAGDAGKFFTVLGADAGENWSATSCILRNVTFSASAGSNGGRLIASGEFVTGFDIDITSVTATVASWVSPGQTYFCIQDMTTKTIGGADIVPYSLSITFNNGAVRVGHDSSGNAQSYHMALFDVTAEIVAKLDANTVGLIDKYRLSPDAGAAEDAVALAWGSVGAVASLEFIMNAVYTGPNSRDYGQESGVGVTLSYQGVDDGTNEAIEVKQTNEINRGW